MKNLYIGTVGRIEKLNQTNLYGDEIPNERVVNYTSYIVEEDGLFFDLQTSDLLHPYNPEDTKYPYFKDIQIYEIDKNNVSKKRL